MSGFHAASFISPSRKKKNVDKLSAATIKNGNKTSTKKRSAITIVHVNAIIIPMITLKHALSRVRANSRHTHTHLSGAVSGSFRFAYSLVNNKNTWKWGRKGRGKELARVRKTTIFTPRCSTPPSSQETGLCRIWLTLNFRLWVGFTTSCFRKKGNWGNLNALLAL